MEQDGQSGVTRDRLGLGVLLVATACALVVCWIIAAPFSAAITWAVALAIVTHPVHDWILARLKKKNLAAGVSVVIVAVVLIAPIVLITRQVVRQTSSRDTATNASSWKAALEQNPKIGALLERLERHIDIEEEITSAGQKIRERLSGFARGLLGAVTQMVICLFALFFFFRDRREILTAARSYIPLSAREFDNLSNRVSTMIHATVYGNVAVSAVQGALGGLMFWILGLPSPLLWGITMATVALIPILGAFLVWAPAAAYFAIQGEWVKAVVMAAWGALVISTMDNLLYPALVGRELRMHTLLVFLAILGGISVFGVSGLVLGPVVLALTLGLLDILRQRTIAGRPAEQPR